MPRIAPTLAGALVLVPLLGLASPTGADEDEDGKPLDRFFRGRITRYHKGVLTIRYDFSEKAQMEDWSEAMPFPIRRRDDQGIDWVEQGLAIRGSTGARHVAVWKGDLRVECRFVLDTLRDVGGALTPEPKTEDIATFTLGERYFHTWDRQRGGQHSIIKFGAQWQDRGSPGEYTGFRYVVRRPPPQPLVAGRSLPFAFGLRRGKLFMEIQDLDLKGKDLGVRLKVHRPGFYVVRGKVRVDDVEITGRLDEDWLEATGVAARLASPIEPE